MTTVAFLQNQWFHNPDNVRRMLAKRPESRERLIRYALFAGCLTGRRLKAAFGDGIDEITWEEISPEIGGHASSVFPADANHVVAVLDKYQPTLVLTFGKLATDCIARIRAGGYGISHTLSGPHPAARVGDVVGMLRTMAERWRAIAGAMRCGADCE